MKMRISEMSDSALLRDYVEARDEEAFAELVRRHLSLVYSAAARRLGNDLPAAEDVAQGVFVQLAQKGRELTQHPVLAGWLYVTASRMAAAHIRHLERRQRRENLIVKADDDASTLSEPTWAELKPFVDDAMQELADDDRHAVVLRYFDGRDFASVGRELGLTADAARMRVTRGLERLRSLLKRRGITSSVLALEALLLRESVQAVPAGLAQSISKAVWSLPTAAASVPALSGATKALVVLALLVLLGGVGTATWRGAWSGRTSMPGLSSASDRSHRLMASGDAMRLLRGRPRLRPQGAPVDPKVAEALGYLRSALFNTSLGGAERTRLLEQSAGMLVGFEGEAIALFREALTATDPDVVAMAIEGIGRFGSLPREFGAELLALLENPAFKDSAGLIANRLLPAVLVMDSPVQVLLALLERRPDLGSSVRYLLIPVISSNKPQLAANREAVEVLLQHPNAEIQAAAQAVLAEVPEAPLPTPELSARLSTSLRSPSEAERRRALLQTLRLQAVTPEIRQALAAVMREDPSVLLRVDARIELARLAPADPALVSAPAPEADAAARDFLDRLDRNEVAVPELLAAIADRAADPGKVIQQLPTVDDAYWNTHGEEKMLAFQVLASLHRDPDVRVYEAAAGAYARLNHLQRGFYSIDELEPYFATMESALTPGQYAIAMRDLKSSLDSYWQARGFRQAEPTHLPKDLVQVLLVGPAHQNRAAYEQMLQAIRQVDPAFEPPQ
jgi:RNA polymerase sigma factor (sigma-70 family)